MAEMSWEKPPTGDKPKRKTGSGSWKFAVGGVMLLGAVLHLVLSGTMVGARFFINVEQVVNNSAYIGQTVRITGAVIGSTIDYDAVTGRLDFTVAHIPDEYEDLATEIHRVVNDPNATQLRINMENQARPDLLQHEAQAILTGAIGEDGIFYATEVLMKCPSRFQEDTPGSMIHLTTQVDPQQ